MFRFTLVAVAMLGVAAAPQLIHWAPAQDAPAAARKVALLVGVNRYDKPIFTPLNYAERDVEELAAQLTSLGFAVTVLKGSGADAERATRVNIRNALDRLVEPLGSEDVMLVMFSGHGQQLDVPRTDGTVHNDAFYCPVDAVSNKPETMVSLSYVTDEILAPNVGRKLLLVDACRDAPSDPSRGSKGIEGKVISLPEDTSVFFSCRKGQKSWEDDELQHGLFTYCVLDAVKGAAAQDGDISWGDVVAHVNRKMASAEMRKRMARPQEPVPAGGVPHTVLGRVEVSRFTDEQLNQYMRTALLHEMNIRRQAISSEKNSRTLRMKFESTHDGFRKMSAFGLGSDAEYEDLRTTLLELVDKTRTEVESSPDDDELDRIRGDLVEWLAWDELSDEQRERIRSALSSSNLEDVAENDMNRERVRHFSLQRCRRETVLSLSQAVSPDIYQALVQRALRDRYWCLNMNFRLRSEHRPPLDLATLLDCESIDAESQATIPTFSPLVIQFSAVTWCGACKNTLPHWKQIQAEYGGRFGLVFVSLDEDIEETRRILANEGVSAVVVKSAAEFYDFQTVPALPTLLLCDSRGQLTLPASIETEDQMAPFSDEQREKFVEILKEFLARDAESTP